MKHFACFFPFYLCCSPSMYYCPVSHPTVARGNKSTDAHTVVRQEVKEIHQHLERSYIHIFFVTNNHFKCWIMNSRWTKTSIGHWMSSLVNLTYICSNCDRLFGPNMDIQTQGKTTHTCIFIIYPVLWGHIKVSISSVLTYPHLYKKRAW